VTGHLTEPLSVVVVEDHPAVRRGIVAVLSPEAGFTIILAGTAREGLDLVSRRRPDVAVVDLELPDASGIDLIPQLLRHEPDLRVVVYTGSIGPRTWTAVKAAGAHALVSKAGALDDLSKAIRTVIGGDTYLDKKVQRIVRSADQERWLTPRERQVLQQLAAGSTAVQVAEDLFLSPETVKSHVQNAMLKLGAETRIQAVAMALERGEITLG
jgi:DNA-binding NarL/FixJ family response regulator